MTAFSAVVLTGGSSRRMGSDKAFVLLDGQPLAGRALTTMRAAGAQRVVAVGGDADRLVALGYEVVADAHPGTGPLGGLVDGLEALSGTAEWAFVMACDQPAIVAELPARLLASATGGSGRADVAVAVVDGVPQVLGALYAVEARRRLRSAFAAGERSVRRVLEDVDGGLRVVRREDLPAGWFVDLDTPGDVDHYASPDGRS